MKIKSKQTMLYCYGVHSKAMITIDPRQKWNVVGVKANDVVIRRRSVTIQIPIEDYERYFEGVK